MNLIVNNEMTINTGGFLIRSQRYNVDNIQLLHAASRRNVKQVNCFVTKITQKTVLRRNVSSWKKEHSPRL